MQIHISNYPLHTWTKLAIVPRDHQQHPRLQNRHATRANQHRTIRATVDTREVANCAHNSRAARAGVSSFTRDTESRNYKTVPALWSSTPRSNAAKSIRCRQSDSTKEKPTKEKRCHGTLPCNASRRERPSSWKIIDRDRNRREKGWKSSPW